MASLAQQLAEWAQDATYERMAPEVQHEVKRRVLDAIGCALGAWYSRPAEVTRHMARRVDLRDGANLFGSHHRTTADLAAFANGALVRYLDFNDTYLSKEPAHPSDNIPAALAAGQIARANGKQIIAAIALGYEAQCRLCDAASLRAHGWDHVVYGALSTALLAGRLYGLDVPQMVHALGLAGVCNFATRQTRIGQISDWKACAFSNAARNGIFAAGLASMGLTGPNDIFEGPRGLMKMVTGPFELQWARDPKDWMILKTYMKFWPAEYHSQSAIDAALQLRSQVGDIDQIESIRIESFEAAVTIIGSEPEKWRPTSRETADHSLPFCVASALRDGELTRESFSEQNIADPQLHALLDRITIEQTDECDAGYPEGIPNKLIVRMKDGRELVKMVKYPHGHAHNPMTDDEVIAKFRRLASGVVNENSADRIIDLALALETLEDVTPLLTFDTL